MNPRPTNEHAITQATMAADLVRALRREHLTIATGESLTAGWVAGAIAGVPGCSDVFRGGVIAYAADVKVSVLGVTPDEIAAGLVSETVAAAMARQAAHVLGADVGLGTTGVAGPQSHGGSAVGSACLGVWLAGVAHTWSVQVDGDRNQVRGTCVDLVLQRAVELLT